MDEVVIITGGSKGLGKAAVEKWRSEGWNVATCSRSCAPQEENAFLEDRCDVTDPEAIANLVTRVVAKWGRIDALINSAGILGPRTTIEEYPADDWQEVLATNLTAPFLLTKAVIPIMRSQRSGVILNISSGAGVKGKERWGAYAAAKFGIEGFTQVLREELRDDHIRVHSFDPGAMRTDMRAAAYPDEDPAKNETPETIARILFDITAVFEPQLTRLVARDYL